MFRIGVGMQQAYGNCLHRFGPHPFDDAIHGIIAQGQQHIAPRIHPLADLQAQPARNQRLRLDIERIIKTRHPDAPQFQHIAETFGGNQRRLGALPLQDRVGGDRARVQHLSDLRGPHPFAGQELRDTLCNGHAVIRGRGGHLATREPSVRKNEGDIGEGSANIGGHAKLHLAMTPKFPYWTADAPWNSRGRHNGRQICDRRQKGRDLSAG